jgi:hypothetical protein
METTGKVHMILREILSRHQLSDGVLLKLKCGHLVEREETALAPKRSRSFLKRGPMRARRRARPAASPRSLGRRRKLRQVRGAPANIEVQASLGGRITTG